MAFLLIAAFLVLALFGWALIWLGLPGTFVIALAAALYAVFADFTGGDVRLVAILLGMAVFAEVLELAVTYLAARHAKVSTDIVAAAIIGGFIGAIVGVPLPIVGSVLGMFSGVFLGSFLYALWKTRAVMAAWKIAKACIISRAVAIGIKAIVGLIMIGTAIVALR